MKAEGAEDVKDIPPSFKDGVTAKLATSGMQHASGAILRKLYGNDFRAGVAKQRPKGFDARPASSTACSKGDDRMCVLAEYALHTLERRDIEFVSPPDGCPRRCSSSARSTCALHPEAAKSS